MRHTLFFFRETLLLAAVRRITIFLIPKPVVIQFPLHITSNKTVEARSAARALCSRRVQVPASGCFRVTPSPSPYLCHPASMHPGAPVLMTALNTSTGRSSSRGLKVWPGSWDQYLVTSFFCCSFILQWIEFSMLFVALSFLRAVFVAHSVTFHARGFSCWHSSH